MIYPVWRQQLVRSLHIHRSKPESKYFQVASVSCEKLPKLRTMVFRGFQDNSNQLLAVTDIRSEKIADWQLNPKAELLWYFVKSREQFRLSCDVSVIYQNETGNLVCFGKLADEGAITNSLYKTQWNGLSEGAQSAFYCPEPKASLNAASQASIQNTSQPPITNHSSFEKTEQSNKNDAGISQHFSIVVFVPTSVDYLDLKTKPHTRTLHTYENQSWNCMPVNP